MIAFPKASEIAERRKYLRWIVAITSMLEGQGLLPFRGHNEGEDSTNREFSCAHGAFKGVWSFSSKHEHNPPSNAHYISPASQNEMIDCCAQEVTNVIVSEMTKSKIYASCYHLGCCVILIQLQKDVGDLVRAKMLCSRATHPVHLLGAKPPLSLKPSDAPASG